MKTKTIVLSAALAFCAFPLMAQEETDVSTTTAARFVQEADALSASLAAKVSSGDMNPDKAGAKFAKTSRELLRKYMGEGMDFQSFSVGYAEQAIKFFSDMIVVSPNSADGYALRAQSLGKLGRIEDAVSDYNKALYLDAGHGGGWTFKMRGSMKVRLGKVREAVDDFSKAIDASPDNPYIYRERAAAYISLGDFDAAAEDMGAFFRFADESTAADAFSGPECSALAAKEYVVPGCAEQDEGFDMDDDQPPSVKVSGKGSAK